jgi:hypothetical protein
MTYTPGFAYREGCAVRYNETEAWECVDGTWYPMHMADACCKASLITEAKYNSMFPNLPDLSEAKTHASDWVWVGDPPIPVAKAGTPASDWVWVGNPPMPVVVGQGLRR